MLAKTYEYYDIEYNRITLGLDSESESDSESNGNRIQNHVELKAYIGELLWKYQIN